MFRMRRPSKAQIRNLSPRQIAHVGFCGESRTKAYVILNQAGLALWARQDADGEGFRAGLRGDLERLGLERVTVYAIGQTARHPGRCLAIVESTEGTK